MPVASSVAAERIVDVAKGGDVITWSIQTLNPATLPDLCAITEQLAELSQERVN